MGLHGLLQEELNLLTFMLRVEKYADQETSRALLATCFHAGFLLGLFF
jgi:hypothetical protein